MNNVPVTAIERRFQVGERVGEVSALLLSPEVTEWLLVLAHGAGAGMRHAFMEQLSERLAARGIATFRYQFPYMEAGRRRPDPPGVLAATVRAAVTAARAAAPGVPLLAGGKSMGGRITSHAVVQSGLQGVEGLVFFGFPLHALGRPSKDRAGHLGEIALPMLFLQGTRDGLADLDLVRGLCGRLGARATLHIVHGADHSFHMLKRSGRTDDSALDELADETSAWTAGLEAIRELGERS